MSLAIKISLAASGLFLLTGMLTGIWKWRRIMTSAEHRTPVYVDIAHRASLLYSFAALVISKLLEYSPFNESIQLLIALLPLFYFAATILVYICLGVLDTTDNQFNRRNFITTWSMYLLIHGRSRRRQPHPRRIPLHAVYKLIERLIESMNRSINESISLWNKSSF